MKTNAYIVVEGVTDREIIKSVIDPALLKNVRIEVAQGKLAAISTARTILKMKRIPTIIITDADSIDIDQIEEIKATYDIMLKQVSENVPYKLLLIKPEIESVFFYNKQHFKRIFQKNIDDNQFILGKYEPKKILSSTLQCSKKNMNIVRLIKDMDAMKELEKYYPFIELTDFLKKINQSEEG